MIFKTIKEFEQIVELSDKESYSKLMELPTNKQVEYVAYIKDRSEYYKKLLIEDENKMNKLEEKIKKQKEEYKRLKKIHLKQL